MGWTAVRRAALTAVAVVVLSACGESSDSGSAEATASGPCKQVVAAGEAAVESAVQAVAAYKNLATNLGPGVVTDDLAGKGKRARAAVLAWLHLVVNDPECFSSTLVAQAQAELPTWQPPGTVPRPDTEVVQ